ncbi:MAG: RsmD family RNA methyltransferase, partial [bacterium]
FNSLAQRISGSRVLDLFAGTGGLGLQALARGASRVVFVEHDPRMAEVIREELSTEEGAERAEVWRRDAMSAIRELGIRGEAFDLILMDPPYGEGWIPRALRVIGSARILSRGGLVVAEGHWRDRPPAEPGFVRVRETRHGETALWFFSGEGEEDRGGAS